MPDVSDVEVLHKATYVPVAAQACPNLILDLKGVDVKICTVEVGPVGPPLVAVCPVIPVVPMHEVVWVQALWIYSIDCSNGMGSPLVLSRSFKGSVCSVRHRRWLLGPGRH